MSNLVRAAEELEFVPKQQLIQMSQDPNASYPSFLVLSEIQRRTQMEKMYAAQQPKPETTVAEELVAEFSGGQGLGAMAQPSSTLNAFQLGGMENMAPPSPMQTMAAGGLTGYKEGRDIKYPLLEAKSKVSAEQHKKILNQIAEARIEKFGIAGKMANLGDRAFSIMGGSGNNIRLNPTEEKLYIQLANEMIDKKAAGNKTGYQSGGLTRQQVAEANALGIDIVNLSDEEIIEQINLANDARRRDMLLGLTPDTSSPLLDYQKVDLLDMKPLSKELSEAYQKAIEPSGFEKFIEGGTEFFWGPARPDAARPILARMTDEPMDYLNYIPLAGALGLAGRGAIRGVQGTIQGIKALRGSKAADDVIDLTKIPVTKVDDIVPAGKITPQINISSTRPNLPAVIPKKTGTDLVPTGTGTSLVPSGGGPLAVIGSNFLSRNPRLAKFLGYGAAGSLGLAGYYALQDDDEKVDLGDFGGDEKEKPPLEKRSGIDPLDLAKLGGIIMSARNMSELGSGITALAGDIQERRYKEKVLTGQQEQMLYTRLNAISKAIENFDGDIESQEYKQLVQAQNAAIQQINSLYGIEGPDYNKLIESLTVKKPDTPDAESKGISDAIQKTFSIKYPFLSLGSKFAKNYFDTE